MGAFFMLETTVKKYESQWDAAADGLTKYISTRNCAKHPEHGSERYTTTGQCVVCTKIRAGNRQKRIKDLIKASRSTSVAE